MILFLQKKNFTIQDVKEYIEKNLGFVWIDNIVFSVKNKEYRTATLKDFSKPTLLYLRNQNNNLKYLVHVKINNEQFIIKHYNQVMDMSEDWVECLSSKVAQGEELKV